VAVLLDRVGAEEVGIIQSLISTCVLHGVDPYTHLVDVLQRIATHPQRDVADLTPRRWLARFADQAIPPPAFANWNPGPAQESRSATGHSETTGRKVGATKTEFPELVARAIPSARHRRGARPCPVIPNRSRSRSRSASTRRRTTARECADP